MVSQSIIGKLLDECESGVATEGCIPVRRDDLKAILQDYMSLRRQVTGRTSDPKADDKLKQLDKKVEELEIALGSTIETVRNLATLVQALQTGSGRVVAGMFGGS